MELRFNCVLQFSVFENINIAIRDLPRTKIKWRAKKVRNLNGKVITFKRNWQSDQLVPLGFNLPPFYWITFTPVDFSSPSYGSFSRSSSLFFNFLLTLRHFPLCTRHFSSCYSVLLRYVSLYYIKVVLIFYCRNIFSDLVCLFSSAYHISLNWNLSRRLLIEHNNATECQFRNDSKCFGTENFKLFAWEILILILIRIIHRSKTI